MSLLYTYRRNHLSNRYFIFWQLKHPVFEFTPLSLTQLVRLQLVPYHSLCSTCVTYRTLCCAIGHQVILTQPLPSESENFPRGGKYPKHVPLPTYLSCLQPKSISLLVLFISWLYYEILHQPLTGLEPTV